MTRTRALKAFFLAVVLTSCAIGLAWPDAGSEPVARSQFETLDVGAG